MKEYIITEEQAQKLLNYIASKPFGEVFELVQMLQSFPPVEKEEDAKVKAVG